MNCEVEHLPQILEELGRNRFLTVAQVVSVASVDSAIYKGLAFFYGTRPIVNVKLRMEQLYMRPWTTPLMPPTVKQRLGVPLEPPKPARDFRTVNARVANA